MSPASRLWAGGLEVAIWSEEGLEAAKDMTQACLRGPRSISFQERGTVMNTELRSLQPSDKQRVMDLVRAAGHDVADWSNYKNGADNPAANPRYCYEWAFKQEGRPSILCLWYHNMQSDDLSIWQALNQRQAAVQAEGARRKRAENFDLIVQTAWRLKQPVRVIVCAGEPRSDSKADGAKRVQERLLDPQPWHVAAYDWTTGDLRLQRGSVPEAFVDQHDLRALALNPETRTREISGSVYLRSSDVRRQVLTRADGQCEYCDKPGFRMTNGSVFLETHHIVPLHQGGLDVPLNVIGLCPNHHREAHYGERSSELAEAFLKQVRERS